MSDDRGGRRSEAGSRRLEVGGRIDLAIDRTVREMLDVEPPADLRAKVMARLQTRAASALPLSVASALPVSVASAFRRKIWIAVPVAAAAVLVLAIMLRPRVQTSTPPPRTVQAADHRLPADGVRATPAVRLAPGFERSRVSHVAPRSIGKATTVLAASFAEPAEGTTEIEPLGPMTPISVAPITQKDIGPEAIALRPLNPIHELQFAPLTPPDRRD